MIRYIIRRLISVIPTLLGVTFVVFMFQRLIPGDPAVAMLGEHATEENVERIREQFGLESPGIPGPGSTDQRRFHRISSIPNISAILGRLVRPGSGQFHPPPHPGGRNPGACAFQPPWSWHCLPCLIAIIIGIPVGIISAARRNSVLDGTTMVGSLVGVSMPIFWLGIMVIMLFAVTLQVAASRRPPDLRYRD